MKQITAIAFLVLVATIVLAGACRKTTNTTSVIDVAAHQNEIQKWQRDRLASLTKDDGWLTLVGLFWLNEGENKFGSDPQNAVVLSHGKATAVAGSLWIEKGHVRLTTQP